MVYPGVSWHSFVNHMGGGEAMKRTLFSGSRRASHLSHLFIRFVALSRALGGRPLDSAHTSSLPNILCHISLLFWKGSRPWYRHHDLARWSTERGTGYHRAVGEAQGVILGACICIDGFLRGGRTAQGFCIPRGVQFDFGISG
jgi:hypothetical protein